MLFLFIINNESSIAFGTVLCQCHSRAESEILLTFWALQIAAGIVENSGLVNKVELYGRKW
jgi:hypothetical protein